MTIVFDYVLPCTWPGSIEAKIGNLFFSCRVKFKLKFALLTTLSLTISFVLFILEKSLQKLVIAHNFIMGNIVK